MSTFSHHSQPDGTVLLRWEGRECILLGTAHVSQQSSEQAHRLIEEQRPDTVCVELDQQRYQSLTQQSHWRHLNVWQVIRQGKGGLLLVNLLMSAFQRRVGKQVGVAPGQDMLSAVMLAQQLGLHLELIDRPVNITMRRAWRKCGLWGRAKLLATLLSSLFAKDQVDAEEIERLKEDDMLHQLTEELGRALPRVKEVLIDERDQYLAQAIFHAPGNRLVAVVGAGHVAGIMAALEQMAAGRDIPAGPLLYVPPPTALSRALPWLLPIILITLIGLGFFLGGSSLGLANIRVWLLGNGAPALLATLFALAHPLTVVSAGIAAPFTALNPTIGVGIVAALVELWLRKPQVGDLENLHQDMLTLRGWYRNRVSRGLLVFIFSSLGGVAGTYLAAYLVAHNYLS